MGESGAPSPSIAPRVLWGRATSSNVQAAMWCLAELGLEVTRQDAGGEHGVVDTAAYRSMNPNGTVPTLVDGDMMPLWETGAILRYLASRYGRAPFWPEDLRQRSDVDRWAEWSRVNIALRFTEGVFWRAVRVPEPRRDARAIEEGLATLRRYLDIAETRLASRAWLTGDHFTLADILFGHCLYRYETIDIARDARPALARYYAALCEREAYREHVMVSWKSLEGTH